MGDFARAFRELGHGVCVVTAGRVDNPVSITLTSLTSVSRDPDLVAFSVTATGRFAKMTASKPEVVVHFLECNHMSLAELSASTAANKFAGFDIGVTSAGVPFFADVRIRLEGTVESVTAAGGNLLYLASIVEVRNQASGSPFLPLVYHDRQWKTIGSLIQPQHLREA